MEKDDMEKDDILDKLIMNEWSRLIVITRGVIYIIMTMIVALMIVSIIFLAIVYLNTT